MWCYGGMARKLRLQHPYPRPRKEKLRINKEEVEDGTNGGREIQNSGPWESNVEARLKADMVKFALLWRLRAQTTLPPKRVSGRLGMGFWKLINRRSFEPRNT